MTVHLYATCWNEEKMLPFLFRHYDPWVDRYFIFDDGSTDGSIDILNAHPRVELRQFPRVIPDSFVKSNQALLNEVWKGSRGKADWVVIIDVDEHLFVPGIPMKDFLGRYKTQGVTVVPALGYQMVSEEFPEPDERLCDTRTWGAPFYFFNKLSIFCPDAIEETNFGRGRHFADPTGRLKLAEKDELLLLHYKFLGFERTYERHKAQLNHVGEKQKALHLKRRKIYTWSREKLRKEWNKYKKRGVDTSRPDLNPWKSNKEIRWWREKNKYRIYRKVVILAQMMARKIFKISPPYW